jgi:hypothetical protein
MDWQTLINIGAGCLLTIIGWFARELWDMVNKLKEAVHEIEIDLPRNYVRKEEINVRFDRIELLLDRLYEKLDQKADR